MAQTVPKLPDDIDALKALVLVNQQQLAAKDNHIAILEEKLRLASQKRFGASSEKANDDQLGLFNEAEQTSSDEVSLEATALDETTVVPEHTRKKPGRKALPDHLPRRRIEHDIADADKVCGCGCQKTKIGEEVSEQLDIIPARIQVLQHVRFKYACRACEGVLPEASEQQDDDGPTVMTAPLPPQPIPKSNASAGLLAYIATSKFCDALHDRQAKRRREWPAALSPGKDVSTDRRCAAARDNGLLDDPLR